MKEEELKKILMQPKMDELMDNRISDNLLSYNPDNNLKLNTGKLTNKLKYKKSFQFISKAAAVILVLVAVGGATAWAAGLLVKTKPVNIKTVTKEEIDKMYEEDGLDRDEYIENYKKNRIKKVFGKGNQILLPVFDSEGNLAERDEDGILHFKDGSTVKSMAGALDPERHEKDIKSSNEAFTELGLPNIIPDYIYENYLVGMEGFIYTEYTQEGHTAKDIMVCFYPDYTSPVFADDLNKDDSMNIFNKVIWFTISSTGESELSTDILSEREDEDTSTISTYTNKNGITCTIQEEERILAYIHFSSETLGNGSIMIEFHDTPMEKVKEILDMLPLAEDISQDVEAEE
jgi:hypothetical protein